MKLAHEVLIENYSSFLPMAVSVLGNYDDASDALIYFAALWAKNGTPPPENASFRTWLCASLVRYKSSLLRNVGHTIHRNMLSLDLHDEWKGDKGCHIPIVDDVHKIAEQRDLLREVDRMLRELRPEEAEALRLYTFKGISLKDVAARMGVPACTVRSWAARARCKLRQMEASYV